MVSENLRREARIDARIKVSVVRGRRVVSLETSDVSFKGLFLRTSEPPPVRSLMRLRVSLPLREIEAHAMAIHVTSDEIDGRSPGVGVQFWGLAGPDRIAWDDFVRDLIQTKRAAAKRVGGESAPLSGGPPNSGIRPAPSERPAPSDRVHGK
ncbi:MAG TPA: PilZ domain-containing protein [Labilithrix sp.]|nr:PilZ domain-containing protein [Labilithrix sp.]